MDARRSLVRARGHVYPLVSRWHRFFVAFSRALVWYGGFGVPAFCLDTCCLAVSDPTAVIFGVAVGSRVVTVSRLVLRSSMMELCAFDTFIAAFAHRFPSS